MWYGIMYVFVDMYNTYSSRHKKVPVLFALNAKLKIPNTRETLRKRLPISIQFIAFRASGLKSGECVICL